MTPAERQIAIEKIEALPAQLEQLIAGVSDAKLNKTYGAGKWTARQVIHHLADSHMHAFIRTRFIATLDHPTIQPYDQEAWAELPDAKTGPVEPSVQILKGLHARWGASCGPCRRRRSPARRSTRSAARSHWTTLWGCTGATAQSTWSTSGRRSNRSRNRGRNWPPRRLAVHDCTVQTPCADHDFTMQTPCADHDSTMQTPWQTSKAPFFAGTVLHRVSILI